MGEKVYIRNDKGVIYTSNELKNTPNEKASYDLLGLIKVGDYVNGYKVVEINDKRIGFGNYRSTSYVYFEDGFKIESVVTKEQFDRIKFINGNMRS